LHLQPQRWRTIAHRAGKRAGESHLLDDYPAFVGARALPNTWLAVAYDPLSEDRLGGRQHPHLAEQQAELERTP
jgi:hypothetical protein